MSDTLCTPIRNACHMLGAHNVLTRSMSTVEAKNIVQEMIQFSGQPVKGLVPIGKVMDFIQDKREDTLWIV